MYVGLFIYYAIIYGYRGLCEIIYLPIGLIRLLIPGLFIIQLSFAGGSNKITL